MVSVLCLMCSHRFSWRKPAGYSPKSPCCPRCFSNRTEVA